MNNTRAVCLNCIDGRIQIPVIQWIKDNYDVDYVDMITEPGMDGLLSNKDYSIEEVGRKINISIKNNNAVMIVVIGHHDCRGNPVSEDVHKEQVQRAAERFKEEFKDMLIVGLWVDEEWECKVVV